MKTVGKKGHKNRPRFVGTFLRHARDHFVPHEGNNHVPKALRHKNLFVYTGAIILLKGLLVALPAFLPAQFLYSSAVTQSNIVTLTNQSRAASGVPPLSVHATLTAAAQARADDMMTNQYFSHAGPDGRRAWSWIRGAGYDYLYAAENLALYFDTAEGVHSGWLASPSHRQNLLSEKYTEIGVGVAQGEFEGFSTFLVVQFFGHPAKVEPTIANDTDEVPTTPSEVASGTAATATVLGVEVASPVIESVNVLPTADGFRVVAQVKDAAEVKVLQQAEVTTLDRQNSDAWTGNVISGDAPHELRLMARSEDGEESILPIAEYRPKTEAVSMYGTVEQARPSPLPEWANYPTLRNGVHGVYLYFIFFLIGAVLLKVLINVRLQRWSVIAHTTAVIGLAVVMLVL